MRTPVPVELTPYTEGMRVWAGMEATYSGVLAPGRPELPTRLRKCKVPNDWAPPANESESGDVN